MSDVPALNEVDAVVAALRGEATLALARRYLGARTAVKALAAEAEPYRIMMESIEKLWHERLLVQGGTHLAGLPEDVEVTLVPGNMAIIRNNPLLNDLLLEYARKKNLAVKEVQDCVYLKHLEPEWHSDLTKLKALAKKYGDEVKKIIDRCFERRVGAPKFAVTVKEDE